MARIGTKKFDRWEFTIERISYGVDVYIVRAQRASEATRFRAVNKELELAIEDTNIDQLRRSAEEHVRKAGKTEWARWIRYWIRFDPHEEERGHQRASISVSWQLIDRCDIGKPTERYRDVEKDGRTPEYGGINTGEPHTGYEVDWHDREARNEFTGCIPHTTEAIKGLETLAAGISALYERLATVLHPEKRTNPAAWLAGAAKSGAPMLPAGKGK